MNSNTEGVIHLTSRMTRHVKRLHETDGSLALSLSLSLHWTGLNARERIRKVSDTSKQSFPSISLLTVWTKATKQFRLPRDCFKQKNYTWRMLSNPVEKQIFHRVTGGYYSRSEEKKTAALPTPTACDSEIRVLLSPYTHGQHT